MSKIIVNPNMNDLDNFLPYVDNNDFFFEIFCFDPTVLSCDEKIKEYIETYILIKDRIYSMHGAFLSINISAYDHSIRNASRHRVIQNCEISKTLGIKNLVVHCDNISQIKDKQYIDNWVDTCYEFYSSLIDKYDINILMENVWDLCPYPMKQLIDKMNTGKFKACIDTGHVQCFSKSDIQEWIDVLNTDIVHFHYNDNNGKIDEHNPPGQGNFDFKALTDKVIEHNINPSVVFEMDDDESIDRIESSIDYLKSNRFYPYMD